MRADAGSETVVSSGHGNSPLLDIQSVRFDSVRDITLNRLNGFLLLCAGEIFPERDGRSVRIGPGDLAVFNRGSWKSLREGTCGPGEAMIVRFTPGFVLDGDCSGEGPQYLHPFSLCLDGLPLVVREETRIPARVCELVNEMQAVLPPVSPICRVVAKTCLKMILITIARYCESIRGQNPGSAPNGREFERMKPVFHLLEQRYGQRITVDEAAREVGMSRSHFMRSFRAATGGSFLSHLNHLRIAKARALLNSTEKTVAQVSEEVGFCDQSHFGQLFRRLVAMTPSEYKAGVISQINGSNSEA